MPGLNLTAEQRQARKAYWAQKQREAAAEAAQHKADTEGLFGVNGWLSNTVSTLADSSGMSAFARGATRSFVPQVVLHGVSIAKNGWSKGLEEADKWNAWQDANYRDKALLRKYTKAVTPEFARGAVQTYHDWRDAAETMKGELVSDYALMRYVPFLSSVKAVKTGTKPFLSSVKAVKTGTKPFLNSVKAVKEVTKPVISASLDALNAYRLVSDGVSGSTQSVRSGNAAAELDAAQENWMKRVMHDPKLTPKEKDTLLRQMSGATSGNMEDAKRLIHREVEAERQQNAATAVKPSIVPKKPQSFLDYLKEYKGEIGFGALGGAAGYGLGHAFKWGMPAKVLSTIAGAALGAYGYNRLKG